MFVSVGLSVADDPNCLSTGDITTASSTIVRDFGGYPRYEHQGYYSEDGWIMEYAFDGRLKIFAAREQCALIRLEKVLEEKISGVPYDENAKDDSCTLL